MNQNKKKRMDLKRRHQRIRQKLSGTKECPRLCVCRSLKNIYAQIIDDNSGATLVAASTQTPALRSSVGYGGNIKAAAAVGELLAQKAAEQKITQVVFDRGGRQYHGRIKALADAARKGGLKF
ncbi:MAG: 50S ribosomal protein L18 [Planctomycetes bacterium]|nr:50S ribosomal protein L18 [Planctomycetota bacterium]